MITAESVKELRERTGAGMMDCKKALSEVGGDLEQAAEWLRKKGLSAAAKKSGRVAAEGAVVTYVTGSVGVVLEVNSETDFVARNEKFQAFTSDLAKHIASNKPADVATLLTQKFGASTVQETLTQLVATIGENIQVRRFERLDLGATKGAVVSYKHGEGRIGVLVEVHATKDASATNPKLTEFARDVAMHVAAMNPVCARSEEVPAEMVAKELEILTVKARETGKKEEMIPKIVEGQINKWKSEVVLMDQKFVKNPDIAVKDLAKQVSDVTGDTVTIKRFVRFELGEGIEKKTANFAEEVAAALKG